MPVLVGYLLLFLGVGVFFVFIHLVMGRLLRPIKPDPEKLTIYECGEPTIGSAWIQFDLRFYVVALLFVIFDVEVAFFFPWAVVFGKAHMLARTDLPPEQRRALTKELAPRYAENQALVKRTVEDLQAQPDRGPVGQRAAALEWLGKQDTKLEDGVQKTQPAAARLAWLAFWDILVFFGVLLVGYAYLWKRGDLDWVRSLAAEGTPTSSLNPADARKTGANLVGAGTTNW
jgi:NADH-quinone oxidoreductase subunit A